MITLLISERDREGERNIKVIENIDWLSLYAP